MEESFEGLTTVQSKEVNHESAAERMKETCENLVEEKGDVLLNMGKEMFNSARNNIKTVELRVVRMEEEMDDDKKKVMDMAEKIDKLVRKQVRQ